MHIPGRRFKPKKMKAAPPLEEPLFQQFLEYEVFGSWLIPRLPKWNWLMKKFAAYMAFKARVKYSRWVGMRTARAVAQGKLQFKSK